MTDLLLGRTAVITGASRGIGRSIAERFAQQGASVVLSARSQDALEDVAAGVRDRGGQAHTLALDITAEGSPEALGAFALESCGSIDVVVNNAGGNTFMAPVAELRASGWAKAMALNLDAAIRLIQTCLPALIASGHGSIVNVSSVTALRAAPLLGAYGAAKAALVSATQTLAVELGTQPVRVNALVPGWIATDLTEFLRENEGLEDSILGRVPMHRWGRPEEIADAALFLASDMSSFMTGQSLVVDGGLAANP